MSTLLNELPSESTDLKAVASMRQMSVYSLNARKQLIDINEDLVNFEANIQVVCKDLTPFEAIVVTQTQLDSGEPIDYKHVLEGMFQVSIRQDSGVYENFLLLLKSEADAVVEVEMAVTPVEQAPTPDTIQPPTEPYLQEPPNRPIPPEEYGSRPIAVTKPKVQEKQGWFKRNWKFLVIAGLILVGGFVLWFLYMRKPSVDPVKTGDIDAGGLAIGYDYRDTMYFEEPMPQRRGTVSSLTKGRPVEVCEIQDNRNTNVAPVEAPVVLEAPQVIAVNSPEPVVAESQQSDVLDPALLTKLQNILKK